MPRDDHAAAKSLSLAELRVLCLRVSRNRLDNPADRHPVILAPLTNAPTVSASWWRLSAEGSPTSCSALRFVQLAGCNEHEGVGAHARIRTGDLFLTKEMLYRLSYMGVAKRSSILSATNWAAQCPRSTM